MLSVEIRTKFLEFFSAKGGSASGGNGHAIVPSSSLIPDDPSVLLTTAGMQQFKRYFTGELNAEKDFGSKNTVSIQKSFRTSDIDEVGDESHLTFFEMLGNFSFGGYFKKEAITLAYEFITKEMGLVIDYVSVFGGEDDIPADAESEEIWKSIDPRIRIIKAGRADNFWGPTGSEGPCGPTTEIYVRGVEIWNIVFNEFYSDKEKKLVKLKTPGIDTGMGLERLAMVSQNVPTIFETDLFAPLMDILPSSMEMRRRRIMADHSRGITFLIADGVLPSNKETGYVLRRLMRRAITHDYLIGEKGSIVKSLIQKTVALYKPFYPELNENAVVGVFKEENEKFQQTITTGLKELDKIATLDARSAFTLYESFGLPFEVIKELSGARGAYLTRDDFDKEFLRHQEISRAGQEKKFGGHGLLLDTGELKAGSEEELKKVTRLHTATHLLQQVLRDVLGAEVTQMGSDITVERTRFDFSFSRKLTPEEKETIEKLVNKKIKEDLPVQFEEMPKSEAEKTGALHFFKAKYPDQVKVYFIAPQGKGITDAWSKEFCGGPHVSKTGEIGEFKITKEEAVAAGVRRIRATVK